MKTTPPTHHVAKADDMAKMASACVHAYAMDDIIAVTCNIPVTTMQPIYWDHSPHGSRTKNCPDHAEVGGGEVMENSNNHSLSQGSGGRAAGCSSHTSG